MTATASLAEVTFEALVDGESPISCEREDCSAEAQWGWRGQCCGHVVFNCSPHADFLQNYIDRGTALFCGVCGTDPCPEPERIKL